MKRKRLIKSLRYDMTTGIFFNRKSGQTAGRMDDNKYVQIWIDGNKYKACDLVWLYTHDCMPKRPIVHINGVNYNDWIDNLKLSPDKNKLMSNTSGVPGVSWDKRDKRWRAQIFNKTKQKNLGNYESFDQAVLARSNVEVPNPDSPAQQYINKMFL